MRLAALASTAVLAAVVIWGGEAWLVEISEDGSADFIGRCFAVSRDAVWCDEEIGMLVNK